MEKRMKLLPPMMPNFISMERPAGLRQEGFKDDFKISITELSLIEAEQYGELMKQSFIQHHKEKTKSI